MGPLVLLFVVVLGMSLIAVRLITGGFSRKDKPQPSPKRKPARKSASKKQNKKASRQRKSGLGRLDDEDLMEMIFENALGKGNKRK